MSDPFSGFPRGVPGQSHLAPLATAAWPDPSLIEERAACGDLGFETGKIWLGRTIEHGTAAGYRDDRHIVTIAGSRAGKGTSSVLPNLLTWPGSVFNLDPKAENAEIAAPRRGYGTSAITGLHQDTYVLAPFGSRNCPGEYLATYDPLYGLHGKHPYSLENTRLLAEGCVIPAEGKDPHWDESATDVIQDVALHLVTWPEYEGKRTVSTLVRLLRDGDCAGRDHFNAWALESAEPGTRPERITALDALLYQMGENPAFDGKIAGTADNLLSMGERERGSVLSTVRRHIRFLSDPEMQAVLGPSDHALRMEEFKTNPRGISVFAGLPARKMASHGRFFRILLNFMVAELERNPDPSACGHPVLAMLDEFTTLGHMAIMETSAAYMAGFDLKLWTIIQDLSQLKRHYPKSWETFLGNAGLIQCFGNVDQTTLAYTSKRLGETEVTRESQNRSLTTTQAAADLSDYEKTRRSIEPTGTMRALSSFALQNDTKSLTETTSAAETVSQTVQKTPLLTPDEIARLFARETLRQLLLPAGGAPLVLRRTPYHADPFFRSHFTPSLGKADRET